MKTAHAPTDFFSLATDAQPTALKLTGQWTLANYMSLKRALTQFPAQQRDALLHLDFSQLKQLDTAGAKRLCQFIGLKQLDQALQQAQGLSKERLALLQTVAQALRKEEPHTAAKHYNWLSSLLVRIGVATERFWHHFLDLVAFVGLILTTWARNILIVRNWRFTSVVAQIEEVGLNAVPIIALLTFLVGAVVAFLGATILETFGATIYTVNLVGFSFLREFAVLLTAILMAGRTASAFTAQIGSMKANEEIDALRAQGMDPMVILVLPRVIAMLISMPLLTFIGMISGIFGGALVCAWVLDISPTMFLSVFKSDISYTDFIVGMAKAPIFAFLIAAIGCQQGLKVTGSAQSVGERTTSAVVQSIFIVILLDAFAALYYMEMGW
ncbi:MAG TPA: ABC transporter permease [Paenalcaligenes sp.]|nr:ABC transporter permease [Paenalcaligenes sp.]